MEIVYKLFDKYTQPKAAHIKISMNLSMMWYK